MDSLWTYLIDAFPEAETLLLDKQGICKAVSTSESEPKEVITLIDDEDSASYSSSISYTDKKEEKYEIILRLNRRPFPISPAPSTISILDLREIDVNDALNFMNYSTLDELMKVGYMEKPVADTLVRARPFFCTDLPALRADIILNLEKFRYGPRKSSVLVNRIMAHVQTKCEKIIHAISLTTIRFNDSCVGSLLSTASAQKLLQNASGPMKASLKRNISSISEAPSQGSIGIDLKRLKVKDEHQKKIIELIEIDSETSQSISSMSKRSCFEPNKSNSSVSAATNQATQQISNSSQSSTTFTGSVKLPQFLSKMPTLDQSSSWQNTNMQQPLPFQHMQVPPYQYDMYGNPIPFPNMHTPFSTSVFPPYPAYPPPFQPPLPNTPAPNPPAFAPPPPTTPRPAHLNTPVEDSKHHSLASSRTATPSSLSSNSCPPSPTNSSTALMIPVTITSKPLSSFTGTTSTSASTSIQNNPVQSTNSSKSIDAAAIRSASTLRKTQVRSFSSWKSTTSRPSVDEVFKDITLPSELSKNKSRSSSPIDNLNKESNETTEAGEMTKGQLDWMQLVDGASTAPIPSTSTLSRKKKKKQRNSNKNLSQYMPQPTSEKVVDEQGYYKDDFGRDRVWAETATEVDHNSKAEEKSIPPPQLEVPNHENVYTNPPIHSIKHPDPSEVLESRSSARDYNRDARRESDYDRHYDRDYEYYDRDYDRDYTRDNYTRSYERDYDDRRNIPSEGRRDDYNHGRSSHGGGRSYGGRSSHHDFRPRHNQYDNRPRYNNNNNNNPRRSDSYHGDYRNSSREDYRDRPTTHQSRPYDQVSSSIAELVVEDFAK